MKPIRSLYILLAALSVSGCAFSGEADVYRVSAEPYSAFVDEDVRNRECHIELGDEVFINGSGAWFGVDGVMISEGGVYIISGNYNGCISVSTAEPVKLVLSNANIANDSGYAVASSSERLVISSESGSSTLSGCGGEYMTAVRSDGAMLFAGMGSLIVTEGAYAAGGIMFSRNMTTICQIVHGDKGDLIYGAFRLN